jgi:hypothetical protein
MKYRWITRLGFAFITLGIAIAAIYFSGSNVTAQSCPLYNATEYIVRTDDIWGGRADINFTYPNVPLFGGSYHRVAVLSFSPFRFYEFGWYKRSSEQGALLAWSDPVTGMALNTRFPLISVTGQRNYTVRYNRQKARWGARLDGAVVKGAARTLDFTIGDAIMAGGEALCGNEEFNCVLTFNAQTARYNGQGYVWSGWTSRTNYVDNPPYNNQDTIPRYNNFFFSHHNSTSCSAPAYPLSTATFDDPGDD